MSILRHVTAVVMVTTLVLVGVLFGGAVDARAADEFIEGNYWALIIGIDRYAVLPEEKQLKSARKDAEAVAAVLRQRYGFAKERMIELYDGDASRKAVFKAFSALKGKVTDKDSLFVYFSGHGAYEGRIEKGNEIGFWLLADSEEPSIDPSSAIPNTRVRDFFSGYQARHVVLVADAFFSSKLMGKASTVVGGQDVAKALHHDKSRWVLLSGRDFPEPDRADTKKNGHSLFAWHLMKALEMTTTPYLILDDLVESLAIRVSNEKHGKLPKGAPLIAAGDEGGQFVFRLLPEFRTGGATEKARMDSEKARMDAEKARAAEAAQKEMEELEWELQKAEEALKKRR